MWKRMLLIVLLFALSISIIGEGVISMANKYCNLQGNQKIKDSYTNINTGFDKVDADISGHFKGTSNKHNSEVIIYSGSVPGTNVKQAIDNLNNRVDEIIVTPAENVSAQEIIDARGGETSLGSRLNKFDSKLTDYSNNYGKFTYPEDFIIPEEFKIDLFKNGCTYETNFDIRTKRIKNGGKTYYVSPNGSDSNDGLTIGTPLKGIDTAVAKSDVETIILLEGNYYLDENWTTQIVINKSLNIIGKGNVRIINAKKVTWTVHDTYPNVYHISPKPANFNKVVSLDVFDEYGDELELTKKTALASEVANIPFSYAVGSNLYMHLSETPTDDNVAVLLGADAPILVTDSVGKTQIKLYMENIKILGGRCCIELITQSDQVQDNYFYGYKCKFLHSHNENAFQGLGGNYYLVECVASYGDADGFNYHMNTKAKKPYAIEINCIGRNNGQGIGETSNQGSTIHDGGSIIRVNGEYYLNQGGNITDAYAMSVNLNCKAYNSRITDPTKAGNFVAIKGAASPAKLWVINCLSFGSVYDLIVDGDMTYSAVIYERNNQLLCGQNNMIGTGQIIEY